MDGEDHSRLEKFRQFRKELRGSSEYLLGGIDVSKDKHNAFLARPKGKLPLLLPSSAYTL